MPPEEPFQSVPVARRRGAPMHAQIAEQLREIISQHFADGDAFFTETQLMERFGVSRPTVRQAMAQLSREGLLVRRPAIGTIVTKGLVAARRTDTLHVGFLVEDSHSEYSSALWQQIVVQCRRRNYIPHIYYTHRDESPEQAIGQILQGPHQERIIHQNLDAVSKLLQERGYRVVSVEAPGLHSPDPVVETDSRMAVQIGVDYLRALGHEQITLLVNEPAERISVQEKIEQFRSILPHGAVVVCGTQVWDESYSAAYAHMGKVWNVNHAHRPTAIMTVSDPGAWAVLRWLSERAISVPGQVSVLGFEDSHSSQFMHPSLSTLAHPIKALAQTAIAMLWDEDDGPIHRRLAPNLVIRESTGPAPSA